MGRLDATQHASVELTTTNQDHRPSGVYLVEGGNEIEGGGKPFMRADEKGFQGELTVS